MKRYLGLSAVLVLSACGGSNEVASGEFTDDDGNKGSYSVKQDGDSSETVIKSEDGEVRIASGNKTSGKLPLGLDILPGAELAGSLVGESDEGAGEMVNFKTKQSSDAVEKFYREEFAAKGITIKSETKSEGMRILAGENGKGDGALLMIIDDGSGELTVNITGGSKN